MSPPPSLIILSVCMKNNIKEYFSFFKGHFTLTHSPSSFLFPSVPVQWVPQFFFFYQIFFFFFWGRYVPSLLTAFMLFQTPTSLWLPSSWLRGFFLIFSSSSSSSSSPLTFCLVHVQQWHANGGTFPFICSRVFLACVYACVCACQAEEEQGWNRRQMTFCDKANEDLDIFSSSLLPSSFPLSHISLCPTYFLPFLSLSPSFSSPHFSAPPSSPLLPALSPCPLPLSRRLVHKEYRSRIYSLSTCHLPSQHQP